MHEILGLRSVEAPDAITPLLGYRTWTVGLGRFWSPQATTPWPVAGELTARCRHLARRTPFDPRSIDRAAHSVPQPECSCGIYAVRDPWEIEAVDARPPFRIVVGAVAGWGRVVVCERGWRAERALILSIFAYPWWDEQTVTAVARTAGVYGVPLEGWAELKEAPR